MTAPESGSGRETQGGPRAPHEVRDVLLHLLRLVARAVAARLRSDGERTKAKEASEAGAPVSSDDRGKLEST